MYRMSSLNSHLKRVCCSDKMSFQINARELLEKLKCVFICCSSEIIVCTTETDSSSDCEDQTDGLDEIDCPSPEAANGFYAR